MNYLFLGNKVNILFLNRFFKMESQEGNESDEGEPAVDATEPLEKNSDFEKIKDFSIESGCIICLGDLSLKKVKKIGQRAIRTVIDASKKRKDKKFKLIGKATELKLHESCYANYISSNSIEVAVKNLNKKRSEIRDALKETRASDFNKVCFICKKEAYNKTTSFVQNLGTINNMCTHFVQKDLDDEKKLLLARLNLIKDNFSSIKPFYHTQCYNKFFIADKTRSVGRPISESMSKVVKFVNDYIFENQQEC